MNMKGGEIVFQQFILVSEELLKEGNDNPTSLSPHERWKKVRRALSVYGLSLMCSQSDVAGVPTAVIVGIPADCISYLPIKDCFYGLTTEHHLPFMSGEWYLGEFATRTSRSVLSDENHRAFIKLKADERWFNEHHRIWVGFAGGELVAKAEDEETVLNQLRTSYAGQERFLSQVLMEDEEDERAICDPSELANIPEDEKLGRVVYLTITPPE